MTEPIHTILGAIVGFFAKSSWDFYWKRRQERESFSHQKRLESLERQLNEFYWPLLFQLKKNDIVRRRIMNVDNPKDGLEKDLVFKISRQYFYPNNEKMLDIIESKYFLSRATKDVSQQIDLFIRHQAIFQAIRNSLDTDVDPIRFGDPWPERLLQVIEQRTRTLQAEYDELLQIGYGGLHNSEISETSEHNDAVTLENRS